MTQIQKSDTRLDVSSLMFYVALEHCFPALVGAMETSDRGPKEGLQLLRKLASQGNQEPITGLSDSMELVAKDADLKRFAHQVFGGDIFSRRNTWRSWTGAGMAASAATMIRHLTQIRTGPPDETERKIDDALTNFQAALKDWISKKRRCLSQSVARNKNSIGREPRIRKLMADLCEANNDEDLKRIQRLIGDLRSPVDDPTAVLLSIPIGYDSAVSAGHGFERPIVLEYNLARDSVLESWYVDGWEIQLSVAVLAKPETEETEDTEEKAARDNLIDSLRKFLEDSTKSDLWDFERRNVAELLLCFLAVAKPCETFNSSPLGTDYFDSLYKQLEQMDSGNLANGLGLARHFGFLATWFESLEASANQRAANLLSELRTVFEYEETENTPKKLHQTAESLIGAVRKAKRKDDDELADDLEYTELVIKILRQDHRMALPRLRELSHGALKRQHIEVATRALLLSQVLEGFAGAKSSGSGFDPEKALFDPFTRGVLLLELIDLRGLKLTGSRDRVFTSYRRQDAFLLINTLGTEQNSELWIDFQEIQEDASDPNSSDIAAKNWRVALLSALNEATRFIVFFSPGYFRSDPCLTELQAIALSCSARSVSVTWVVVDGAACTKKEAKKSGARKNNIEALRELVRVWAKLGGQELDPNSLELVLKAQPLFEHAISPYLASDQTKVASSTQTWVRSGFTTRWRSD